MFASLASFLANSRSAKHKPGIGGVKEVPSGSPRFCGFFSCGVVDYLLRALEQTTLKLPAQSPPKSLRHRSCAKSVGVARIDGPSRPLAGAVELATRQLGSLKRHE